MFTRKFWDNYLAEYNNVAVLNKGFSKFIINKGSSWFDHINSSNYISNLGKVQMEDVDHASMIEASYETDDGGIVRKSLMFAFFYNNGHDDRFYIIDCSSDASAYKKWHPVFLKIIKSVVYKAKDNPMLNKK